MEILYGVEDNYVNITEKIKKTKTIPYGDLCRARLYGDHLPGILKHINIDGQILNETLQIEIDFDGFTITTKNVKSILDNIHDKSTLRYGSFREEFPEQVMAVNFIKKDNVVLEIGGNIGRNSIIISNLLRDSSNLVVLESDTEISKQLIENRDINNLSFHVESSALSKRKLIQKGWDTLPSDTLLPGYNEVTIISFDEIEKKYSKKFDVLVADCEGALFYIFQDFPEMLSSIHTIIMENDYHILSQKEKVDEIMTLNGFKVAYTEPGGWGPCSSQFFEVWSKLSEPL